MLSLTEYYNKTRNWPKGPCPRCKQGDNSQLLTSAGEHGQICSKCHKELNIADKAKAERMPKSESVDLYSSLVVEWTHPAVSVRKDKEKHPEDYCPHKKCLWHTVTWSGAKDRTETHKAKWNPCRNHPELNKEMPAHIRPKETNESATSSRCADCKGEGHTSAVYAKQKDGSYKYHGNVCIKCKIKHVRTFDESVLTEKIHPGEDWHKNDPEELLAHIYWLHNKTVPKDVKVRHKAYRGIVKQLHASNPAPSKHVLDKHLNWHINSSKRAMVEAVISAAHATGRSEISAQVKADMAKRKQQHKSTLDSVKAAYAAAITPKETSHARRLAVSDMKKLKEHYSVDDYPQKRREADAASDKAFAASEKAEDEPTHENHLAALTRHRHAMNSHEIATRHAATRDQCVHHDGNADEHKKAIDYHLKCHDKGNQLKEAVSDEYKKLKKQAAIASKVADKASMTGNMSKTDHVRAETHHHRASVLHAAAHKHAPTDSAREFHAQAHDDHADASITHGNKAHAMRESVELVEKKLRFKTPGGIQIKRRRPANMPMRPAHAVER